MRPVPMAMVTLLLAGCAASEFRTSSGRVRDARHVIADPAFLEQYAATRRFSAGRPASIKLMPDGSAVLFLRSGPRSFVQDLYEFDVETGEELGKNTDNLEGFTLHDKGYFGPGQLPQFNRQFFEIPHGRKEEWLFEEFKAKLQKEGMPAAEELVAWAGDLKEILDEGGTTRGDE